MTDFSWLPESNSKPLSVPLPVLEMPAMIDTAPLLPTLRFMLAHPAHILAFGFASGLSPIAPGTAGTLWAWMVFWVLQHWLSPWALGWLVLGSIFIGWWVCSVTARNLRVLDPSSIVWDEIAAFWLILWLVTPTGFVVQAVAFALFRYFDAAKPGPVHWADQLSHDVKPATDRHAWTIAGFGIMFDDLVAAFCTLLVITFWRFWFIK